MAGLVLKRNVGERILLRSASGEEIWLELVEVHQRSVRVQVEADRDKWTIIRGELASEWKDKRHDDEPRPDAL